MWSQNKDRSMNGPLLNVGIVGLGQISTAFDRRGFRRTTICCSCGPFVMSIFLLWSISGNLYRTLMGRPITEC